MNRAALVLILSPLIAMGQVLCTLGPAALSYKPSSDEKPASDVMQLAGRVNAAFTPFCLPKCPAVAIFRNATAANAMLIIANGEAKIVYAPQFFTSAYEKYGEGAILSVIAHEYGHAMSETTPAAWMNASLTKNWSPELRADAWAGCALAKIDLSQTNLTEALAAASKYPSPAHPGWTLRLPAWRLGYTQCGGDSSKFDRGAGGSRGK
jgi:hypothetical protein